MRPFLFLIICLFSFSAALAQKKQNVYFLKYSGQEVKLKEDADFIRVIQEPDSGATNFKVLEYFPDNTRRFIGEVSSFNPRLIYDGLSVHFHKNGRKEKQITYNNGVPTGKAYYFYPNGKIQKELIHGTEGMKVLQGYGKSYQYKLQSFYDSSGVQLVKEGTGFVSEKDGRFIQEGHYVNGMRDGIWKFFGINGIKSEQVYAAGLFVSGKTINPNGSTSTHLSAEALPEFKGGMKAFNNYLVNNIQYPADAKQLRIDGTVLIALVVEPNGSLTGIKVIKSVHPSLDQEALRVIRNSPKWIPGHQHGIPVRVAYTVPVAYKLGLQ